MKNTDFRTPTISAFLPSFLAFTVGLLQPLSDFGHSTNRLLAPFACVEWQCSSPAFSHFHQLKGGNQHGKTKSC